MQKILLLFFLSFIIISCKTEETKTYPLEKGNVTELGFNQQKLDSLGAYLEKHKSEALMILSNGKIVYEWGNTDKKITIHSIRKAMLNSLYGIYINNGTIDTTLTLQELHIDDIDGLTAQEKTATIADLLKSRSGIYHNAAAVSEGMLESMPKRGVHKPNEAYYYNNWDFNTLGYILEKQTGKKIYDLFYEDIAKPLGMSYANNYITAKNPSDDWKIPDVDGFYQYETNKSKYPAYHFRLSARDMALYGQLFLNNGEWNGKQIIPKSWIDVSTKAYSITDPNYGIGYGMLWRILLPTKDRQTKSYFHTGNAIHMLGVYPAADLVLVHRVDTEKEYTFQKGNFYDMIALVWDAKDN